MFSPVGGYHTFPAPQVAIFQKTGPQGMAYLGSAEAALYRQSAPAAYHGAPTTFVGPNCVPNNRFARQGGNAASFISQHLPASPLDESNANVDRSEVMCQDGNKSVVGIATMGLVPSVGGQPSQLQQQTENLANTKEKTPMCLINELARFNKVQHQYCLTDEQGPAHKKTFFVKLKLGEEEFTASGASIKKAQHAAASVALLQTNYKHPTPKRVSSGGDVSHQPKSSNTSVTPTVELNALAMKRGEPAVYRPIERKAVPQALSAGPYYPQSYNNRLGPNYNNQRYRYQRTSHHFSVALKVGSREFIGEGETLQAARHNAASMALKILKNLPMPSHDETANSETPRDQADENEGPETVKADGTSNETMKSAISVVHEVALKRNFTVEFEIVKESGPPHMRIFVTRCKCGDLAVDGEGSSKKLSKKHAADKMVAELKKLPPLPPPATVTNGKPKKTANKPKQSKNLIKSVLNNCSAGVNPISRLIQIQQSKKEPEPVFTLIEEKGLPRNREFHIQVTVGETSCTGVAANKRLAKRDAAEQMLQMLGYSLLAAQPKKPAIKISAAGVETGRSVSPSSSTSPARNSANGVAGGGDGASKRVTFVDADTGSTASVVASSSARSNVRQIVTRPNVNSALSKAEMPPSVRSGGNIEKLHCLAKVMGFEVKIDNYPKDGSKKEYISLLTICTQATSQFICVSGPSIEAANDNAALEALNKLSEFGLSGLSSGPSVDSSSRHRLSAVVLQCEPTIKQPDCLSKCTEGSI